MFWADQIAAEIKQRGKSLEWVDDMKTPSGRIHVGSLRGVVIHDLVAKCLAEKGVKTKSTYIFNDHDPMDGLPIYLPKEFEEYLGLPLFKVPSPEKGYTSFAEYFGKEFEKVFKTIGCSQEVVWSSQLYLEGKFNDAIRIALDNADTIKAVYEEIYDKKIPGKMYPFQVACQQCGKISTTTVTDWDGQEVTYTCGIDKVDWTKGCGYSGKRSPFSSQNNFAGKLPWKIDWPAHWSLLGITVEAAGKDHMTAGGSHDVASKICERVFKYSTPFAFSYEWFILGKKKMSTSKGVGASAIDMLDILPSELLRFVMVRTRINSEINFDLAKPDTIPSLFDEYQRCADAYFEKGDPEFARAFELSQINGIHRPPNIRFSVLAQWVQMPNMQSKIEEENLTPWVPYVKNWLENYAPESEKFFVQEQLPDVVSQLSAKQKEFLKKISQEISAYSDAEKLQFDMYEWGKALGLTGKDVFGAIYLSLVGKGHGPKAAWLILSLDKEFVKQRFQEASSSSLSTENTSQQARTITIFNNPKIFSIDTQVFEKFPSVSVGVAIIKGVSVEKMNEQLEKEKKEVLSTLEGLTTEEINFFPEVQSYRKLYKEMGIDWHSRRPSPEALIRRIALGKGLYTINTCVDAYNLVVMRNKISVGAFDLDTVAFPTVLRFAKTGEEILLLGDTEATQYKEKELAYFDQNGGYNIDFNYRDAQRTAVRESTKNILLNVDGIYSITPEMVQKVLQESCDMIVKYCGGTIESFGVIAK